MKNILLPILFCLVFSAPCLSEVRINLGVVLSDFDLSVDTEPHSNGHYERGGFGLSLHGGYLTESNIIFDAGISAVTDNFFYGSFDSASLSTTELLVGYSFQRNSIYFEPKIGLAAWSLELREGSFLNSGPERVNEIDGVDPVIFLTLGKRLSSIFGMSLSYKYMAANEVDSQSVVLGFDWHF